MDILFKNDHFVFSYRVGGILKHNGKILLQRPKNDDYAIIGGHVAAMALGTLADHAGNLLELADHRVTAALILLTGGGEILRPHLIQCGGGQLVQRRHRQTALSILHSVGHELPVAGDEAADASAAGGEALGHRVDEDDVLRCIGELTEGLERLPGVDKLPVGLITDEEQVVLPGHVHQHLHLLMGQDGAGGVAGVGHQNGTEGIEHWNCGEGAVQRLCFGRSIGKYQPVPLRSGRTPRMETRDLIMASVL